jgi:hypothetical protein
MYSMSPLYVDAWPSVPPVGISVGHVRMHDSVTVPF